ncbi:MAG: arginine--tRNA ligase [Minisyncoccia bacterium]
MEVQRQILKEKIKESILELQKEKILSDFFIPNFDINFPVFFQYGDFTSNIAILLSKVAQKPPIGLANLILEKLNNKKINFLEKIEISPQGFLNFFLKKEVFLEEINNIFKEKERYPRIILNKKKTIVIDYSSPNIAKSFGIGHLRSTIIGHAIYNLFKFLGYKSIGDNHLGDWGTQFGNLIFAILKWGGKKNIKEYTIYKLEKLYVKFHKEAQKNPKIKEEGRKYFFKLEKRDEKIKQIWREIVKLSLKEFNKIYKILDIKIDFTIGESFYLKFTKEIIKELQEKGILSKSEGALIIKFKEKEFPPAILVKSDGTSTYFLRDLAAIKYRLKKWKPDIILYEVGAEQSLYMKQLFEAVKMLKWDKIYAKKETYFFHLSHGLYLSKGGKISTRQGTTIHLEKILNKAIQEAKKILSKSKAYKNASEKIKEKVAKKIAISAIKYNDLRENPQNNIIFDLKKCLNLKGNSGPYLQYTLVRANSVLKKAKINRINKIKILSKNPNFLSEEEFYLLKEICKFRTILLKSQEKFSPNIICNYIFNLSQKFNLFYERYPILNEKNDDLRKLRLLITFSIAQILKNSFKILGLSVLEKM